MVNVVFRFPAGRYHATPWGNHVNEGLVEWPPSPWRIVRALLATGFSKLGWREPVPEARELIDSLAAALPDYRLPAAIGSHTRHFMPINSKKPEDRTKVFDACAYVGKGAEIAVSWPVVLSTRAASLLAELVPKISYLGRAESVVEARVVSEEALPGGVVASAADANRPGVEPIALLAPMTADAYAIWLGESRPPDVNKSAARKGKTSKPSPYPADSFAALLVDTTFLQEHGWTQPPGSRRVHYYRPPLATSPRGTTSHARAVVWADTALLALASDTRRAEVLPLSLRTLPQAELLHRGLVSRLGDSVCPELTGRDREGRRLEGHRHASLLPLDLGRSGTIDHFLVHAPMGLGAEAQYALRTLRKTFSKTARVPLFVTLAGLGDKNDFLRLGGETVQEFDEARVWKSKTPFVPPRHLKERRHSLEDQVRAELATRGLPAANRIDVMAREEIVALGFHRFVRERRDVARRPPAPRFFGLRIEFERDVRGPITLGYASHFGLGLFVPERKLG